MIIERTGVEPFLLSSLRFAELQDTSSVRIDLSKVRLADPLTVLGAALVAHLTALGQVTPQLTLPEDDAEIERLTVLGLFDCIDEAWREGFRSSRRRALAARCLPLCRLDPPGGGRVDFVARCLDLLSWQREDPRLLRAIGQILVELVDNAAVHARSPAGTFGAARLYTADEEEGPALEVAVGDAGVGMAGTLGARHRRLAEPVHALKEAFKPRVSGMPPGGPYCGLGLHLVRQAVRRRIPACELVILSGDAFGALRPGGRKDRYGRRSDGCAYARSQLQRWGTWARLRVPLGT